jgi:hypothetical protein
MIEKLQQVVCFIMFTDMMHVDDACRFVLFYDLCSAYWLMGLGCVLTWTYSLPFFVLLFTLTAI